MRDPLDHNEVVALIYMQLIVSLLVMPITPVIWICVNGQVTSIGQRFSRMSPMAWALFFPFVMSGTFRYLPSLCRVALWPVSVSDSLLYTLIGTLMVFGTAVGAHYMSVFLRWGHGYAPILPIVVANTHSTAKAEVKAEVKGAASSSSSSSTGFLSAEEARELTAFRWTLPDVAEASLTVVEAMSVEYAWRVYLLPRLLFSLSPLIALVSMSLLETLSSLPVLLYTVCADSLTYPEAAFATEAPIITRHPPTILTVLTYAAHQLLLNVALGTVAMIGGFCLWPGVVISLYWSHVSHIVSGGMLLSSYLPLGMELLARAKLQSGGKRISVAGWLRGTPWKVSCEGLAGCIAMTPVLALAYLFTLKIWKQEFLQRVSSSTSLTHPYPC